MTGEAWFLYGLVIVGLGSLTAVALIASKKVGTQQARRETQTFLRQFLGLFAVGAIVASLLARHVTPVGRAGVTIAGGVIPVGLFFFVSNVRIIVKGFKRKG